MRYSRVLLMASAVHLAALTQSGAQCVGDCDGDRAVTINELIVGVNVLLGTREVASCTRFDGTGDGVVTINELVLGVNAVLFGCDAPPQLELAAACLQPGTTTSLQNCAGGSPWRVSRCESVAACLAGGAQPLANGTLDANGTFETTLDSTQSPLIVEVDVVDPVSGGVVTLRTIDIGAAAAGGGRLGTGAGGTRRSEMILSPISEAALRLISESGEDIDARTVESIIAAVVDANATTDFAGLPVLDAVRAAQDAAREDLEVRNLLLLAPYPVQRRFGTGSNPVSVASVDINQDGREDLLTANFGTSDVSVLMGTAGQLFANEVRVAVGEQPIGLVVADFDSDEVLDLAVSNSTSADVSILLASEPGRFGEHARIAVGVEPSGLAAADFDADGAIDLAVADRGSDSLSVLFGDGQGGFPRRSDLATGSRPWNFIAAGDVNADGLLDIATPNNGSGDVSVFLGSAGGAFATEQRFEVGSAPTGATIADVDGDGRGDLIVTNCESDDVTLLRATTAGLFALPQHIPVGDCPETALAADLNGDGDIDVVVSNVSSDDASLLIGKGDGEFFPQRRIATGGGPHGIATLNLDGDETPDLLIANFRDNDLSVLSSAQLP